MGGMAKIWVNPLPGGYQIVWKGTAGKGDRGESRRGLTTKLCLSSVASRSPGRFTSHGSLAWKSLATVIERARSTRLKVAWQLPLRLLRFSLSLFPGEYHTRIANGSHDRTRLCCCCFASGER